MKKNILPDWYSPDFYIKELSLEQWITELDRRRRFYISATGIGFPVIKQDLKTLFERAIIKKETGLLPLKRDYFIPPPIKDLPPEYRNIKKPLDMIERDGKLVASGGVQAKLCIDMLHYSNETLKEYFEKWLLETRKELAKGEHADSFFGLLAEFTGQKTDEFNKYIGKKGQGATSYKQADLNKWHKFKLLGVIDFVLWGKVADVSYSNDYLNSTLYSYGVSEGSRDKIVAVKGWAYELFGAGGIEQLQGLKKIRK